MKDLHWGLTNERQTEGAKLLQNKCTIAVVGATNQRDQAEAFAIKQCNNNKPKNKE